MNQRSSTLLGSRKRFVLVIRLNFDGRRALFLADVLGVDQFRRQSIDAS
jgi:hypothetical protein